MTIVSSQDSTLAPQGNFVFHVRGQEMFAQNNEESNRLESVFRPRSPDTPTNYERLTSAHVGCTFR